MEENSGTYAIRSQMFECILLIFLIILAAGNIRNERILHTHIHIYTQLETVVMTIGKICKADLPKTGLHFYLLLNSHYTLAEWRIFEDILNCDKVLCV